MMIIIILVLLLINLFDHFSVSQSSDGHVTNSREHICVVNTYVFSAKSKPIDTVMFRIHQVYSCMNTTTYLIYLFNYLLTLSNAKCVTETGSLCK